MHNATVSPVRLLAAAVVATSFIGPQAMAGGSVAIDELMPLFTKNSKLAAEISTELTTQKLPQAKVVCSAVRLGRQWQSLGGERIGPYSCDVGDKQLIVSPKQTFFDIKGVAIAKTDETVTARAANVVESDLSWEWKGK